MASSLTIGVVAAVGVGLIAAGAMLTEIGPWYRALKKPAWKPSDALFGPVWTTIFFLMGTSAVLAWEAADAGQRGAILAAFGVNAVLNAAWSGIFFKLKRPDLAFFEILLLWLSIVWMIAVAAPVSLVAGLLILPYLAWVSFAAALNLAIVRLNRPGAA